MRFDHLHLILNHVPVIGIIIAFALFLLSFSSGNGDLRRASLIVFAGIALLTIPTFVSGVGAEASIRSEPGVSATLVRRPSFGIRVIGWTTLYLHQVFGIGSSG